MTGPLKSTGKSWRIGLGGFARVAKQPAFRQPS